MDYELFLRICADNSVGIIVSALTLAGKTGVEEITGRLGVSTLLHSIPHAGDLIDILSVAQLEILIDVWGSPFVSWIEWGLSERYQFSGVSNISKVALLIKKGLTDPSLHSGFLSSNYADRESLHLMLNLGVRPTAETLRDICISVSKPTRTYMRIIYSAPHSEIVTAATIIPRAGREWFRYALISTGAYRTEISPIDAALAVGQWDQAFRLHRRGETEVCNRIGHAVFYGGNSEKLQETLNTLLLWSAKTHHIRPKTLRLTTREVLRVVPRLLDAIMEAVPQLTGTTRTHYAAMGTRGVMVPDENKADMDVDLLTDFGFS